jgi:hypothetical protein
MKYLDTNDLVQSSPNRTIDAPPRSNNLEEAGEEALGTLIEPSVNVAMENEGTPYA